MNLLLRLFLFFGTLGLAVALPSTPIKSVTPHLDQMQKWDDSNGDTADPFWADDDALYHFMCDGNGFGTTPRNLSFNKLSGSELSQLTGSQINSMDEYGKPGAPAGPDGANWKVCGQECIDGVFYAFVAFNQYGNKSKDPLLRQTSYNSSLIKSTDHGLTWTRSAKENSTHPMWPGSRFGSPSFIHYGRNGGTVTKDEANRYVYAISNNGFWNGGDDFILARILRTDLPNLKTSDWTYFSGGDGLKNESWSVDISKAQPIIKQPAKLGWTAPVFIPALHRYLLVSWYVTPTLTHWFTPDQVVYDFYEAEFPWGQWSLVSSFNDHFFLDRKKHMYGPNLCAKYQEKQGNEVKVDLYTSGCTFEKDKKGLYKIWRIPLTVSSRPAIHWKEIGLNDPALKYQGSWSKDKISTATGNTLEYLFQGSRVRLLAQKSFHHGAIDIFIDGNWTKTVNLNQEDFPTLTRIPVFETEQLPSTEHVLKIVTKTADPVCLEGLSLEDPASN